MALITKQVTVTTVGTLVQSDDGVTTDLVHFVRLTAPAGNTNNVYWGRAGFTRNGSGCGGILAPSGTSTIEAFHCPFILEDLWFDADTNGNKVYITAT